MDLKGRNKQEREIKYVTEKERGEKMDKRMGRVAVVCNFFPTKDGERDSLLLGAPDS